MSSINVASVTAEVVPDARTFREKLDAQLHGLSATVDLKIDDAQVKSELERVTRSQTVTIKPKFDDSTARAQGAKSGLDYGGAFGASARARIDAALKALPELKIGASTSEADQKIKDLSARLQTLRDQRIGVDIPTEQALAEIEAIRVDLAALGKESPDITVQVNTTRATAELAAFRAEIEGIDSIGAESGGGGGGPGLIFAGIAAGATLVGPAVGAGTAALFGFAGAAGAAGLAYYGLKQQIADGTEQGKALQSQLDQISTSFHHLSDVAAIEAGPGVIGALSQVDDYIGRLDGPVAALSADLGDALSISADALITGLETAAPLMDDMGGYAKTLAQHLDDFAHSQEFRNFLDYAQRELPQVATMLGDVGQAMVNLAILFAPTGDSLVADLDGIANGLSKVATVLHAIDGLDGVAAFDPANAAKMAAMNDAASRVNSTFGGTSEYGKKAADALKAVNAMLAASSAQAQVTYPIVDELGNVLYDVNGKATDATTALQNLENSIRGLGNTALDVRSNERAFQQAIDDATAAAKKNGRTLNDNTQAGRDNAAVLDRIATTNHGVTAALIANHASQGRVNESMRAGRKAYIDAATAMTGNRQEAKRLADQAGFTAGDVRKVNDALREAGRLHPKPTITVRGADAALLAVRQVQSAIAALHDRSVTITTYQRNAYNKLAAMGQAKAGGGPIIGPGTKTSDSVPVMGSNGEYMIQAAAVDKYGVAFFDQLNTMRLAAGGPVTSRLAPSSTSASQGHANPFARTLSDSDISAMARAMANVQIGLDGRTVSQSIDQSLGQRVR